MRGRIFKGLVNNKTITVYMPDEEILKRLLALNLARSAG